MLTQLPLVMASQEYQSHPPPPRRRICDLPAEERPLYRLHQYGSNGLSTTELLSLLLGTAEAPGLAQDLLDHFDSLHGLARASQAQLLRIHGIGEAQAARLMAVLELSRRLQAPLADERPQVSSPGEAALMLAPRLSHLTQEELHVILLDTRNRVLGIYCLYKGSLNASVIRIGEIFRPAGEVSPSPEDVAVTRQLVKAGKLLDIEVLDHVIVGQGGQFTSLKERGVGFDVA